MNVDTFPAGTSTLESAVERPSACPRRDAFQAAGGSTNESPARAISPVLQGDDTSSLIEFLSRRYSMGPKYLACPGPSAQELLQAAQLALRAPDHRRLRPFRFVLVSDHQRERLGKLFAADAAWRGHGPVEIERTRERAHNGPVLVALLARVGVNAEDVPQHEQWICVGAAMMNFLNGLHLLGYGAKVLSGASVCSPDIQAAFCAAGETLVAWVVAGTPTQAGRARHDDNASDVLSEWS